MDGSYLESDLAPLPIKSALDIMKTIVDLIKKNEDCILQDVVLSVISPRDDITLYENFFLILRRFPYPEIVLNYKTETLDFFEALSKFSIEATVFFGKNLVETFSHSFMNFDIINVYHGKVIHLLETTKEMLNENSIWDEEWAASKELMGVDIIPMWNTDITFSNSIRGSYNGEIDKMINRAIFFYNCFVVEKYITKDPSSTPDELFKDSDDHEMQPVKKRTTESKPVKVKKESVNTPKKSTNPNSKTTIGNEDMLLPVLASIFKRISSKGHDENVKDI